MANVYTNQSRRTLVQDFGVRHCTGNYPAVMQAQGRLTESSLPLIMPLAEVRIICPNCYRASPGCRDFKSAVKSWNESLEKWGANAQT